jgi:DNA helicase-2/ATP-dependent DNA helicase PcrA
MSNAQKKTGQLPQKGLFDTLYVRLNKAQKKAVDTIDGPVMVIAGPGTGKTSILTLRIANIVRSTDTAPSSILALTFTESGVKAMRQKIVDIMGTEGYAVTIATFHGFCQDIIKRYPEYFPRVLGGQAVTEAEKLTMVEEVVMEATTLAHLKPIKSPTYHVPAIMHAISELKRDNVTPALCRAWLEEEKNKTLAKPDTHHTKGAYAGRMKAEYSDYLRALEKSADICTVFEGYEQRLAAAQAYDFEDMILFVIRALEADTDLLLSLQEQYQYVLADEHQDTNFAQNRLLELITSFHEQPNLFIVGDEKQAIFRFQGASLDNFLYFKKRFPEATLIQLNENYRSTQTILDSTHELIGRNILADQSLRVVLTAKAGHTTTTPITVHAYATHADELAGIAETIKNLKVPLSSCAVLYRDNREAAPLQEALSAQGIASRIYSDTDCTQHPAVRRWLILLRATIAPHDPVFLLPALMLDCWQAPIAAVYAAAAAAKEARLPLPVFLTQPHAEVHPAVIAAYKKITEGAQKAAIEPLVPATLGIMREAGLLAVMSSMDDSYQAFAMVEALVHDMNQYAERHHGGTVAAYIAHLDRLYAHGLSVRAPMPQTGRDEVVLMTTHRSKGLEFDYVFVVNVIDGHWSNRRRRGGFVLPVGAVQERYSLEDDRRLLYVALTRARLQASISYGLVREDGEGAVPSQFIEELGVATVSHAARPLEERVAAYAAPTTTKIHQISLGDAALIKHLFLERGFSATSINNYLACPFKYIFLNLLRLPEGKKPHMMYGTAVHAALQLYVEKEGLDFEAVMERFHQILLREGMSDHDIARYEAKGREELGIYLEEWGKVRAPQSIVEYAVVGRRLAFSDMTIPLTGKIDRIDIAANGSDATVIDYKTSKPKSRNELLGKTKNADGNYVRQLVFYKLLLEEPPKDRQWIMRTGALHFIEPDDSNHCRVEVFDITDEQVGELTAIIEKAAGDVVSGIYASRGCGKDDCEYCKLAAVVRWGK